MIVERYLDCLRNADADGIDALFSRTAHVDSPLYGRREARPFYADLFSVTNDSTIDLIDVLYSKKGPQIAAHFRYAWTMSNGELVTFDCVDLFRLEEEAAPQGRRWFGLASRPPTWRIAELKIIYDTHEARPNFDRVIGGD